MLCYLAPYAVLLLNNNAVKIRSVLHYLQLIFIGANSHEEYKLVENQTTPVIKIPNELKEFWYIYF